jgi:hypothetical protein
MAFKVEAQDNFLVVRSGEYIFFACKIPAFILTCRIVPKGTEILLFKEMGRALTGNSHFYGRALG